MRVAIILFLCFCVCIIAVVEVARNDGVQIKCFICMIV